MIDFRTRLLLLVQLGVTLTLLALPLPNAVKAVALPIWWWLTFDGLSVRELVVVLAVDAVFTTLDVLALGQGVFVFDDPDFLGMPAWEPLMYGFYLLHTHRMLGAPRPAGSPTAAVLFTACFAVPFALPLAWLGHDGLFAVTAIVLGVGLASFRGRWDFAYAGYLLGLGSLLEHVGTASGQWHYDGTDGPVPLWSAIMFAGIGLALRRLVLRFLIPAGDGRAEAKW